MTPQEVLARIAELVDQAAAWDGDVYSGDIRSLLAEVTPEAGVTLTPEEAALALLWKQKAVRHGYVIDTPDDELAERLGREAAR